MIEKALRAVLLGNPGVSGLVGTRIYPMLLPQAATWPGPSMTYQRISTTSPVALAGEIGPERMRIQVDCWDTAWSGARNLALAVKAALHGFSGVVTGQDDLDGVFLESEQDFFESAVGPGGQGMYRVSSDYFVHVDMEVAA